LVLPGSHGLIFSATHVADRLVKPEWQIDKRLPKPGNSTGRFVVRPRRWIPGVRAPWVVSAAFSAVFILVLALLYSKSSGPPLEVPVPSDLAKLEPQLRAYLTKEIDWVRATPNDPNRQATLGIVYAANSLWPEARIAFQNSAKLKPGEPLARLYASIATQEIGDLDTALSMLRKVTTQFPDFPQGYYHFGEALLRAGMIEEAGPAFQRLIVLAPRQWHGYAGLGDVKLRQGNYAEAAKLLAKAVESSSDAKRPHYLLGLAYRGLGRLEDAKLELALGVSQGDSPMDDAWSVTAPKHGRLLQDQMDAANEYGQKGRPDKAVEILSEALVYQPENLTLVNALAIACNRSGQPDKARQLLLKVIEKDNRFLPAYITISYSYADLRLNEEALRYAARAIELGPNLAQSYLAKANALLAAEHDVEALSALESAYRCDPQNAEIQLEMGNVCLWNLQRAGEATEHYRKAIELNPALTPAYVRLADLCLRLGQAREAAAAIEILRKLSPKAPELVELEVALRKFGQSGNSPWPAK